MMRRKGVTLLEMLVAIAVFVVGMVYVLRVFPGGMKGIRYGEQVTLASSLAKTQLSSLIANPGDLPDAIAATNPQVPGEILLTANPDDADPDLFRLIYGEPFSIPAPTGGEAGWASYYLLRFAPADPNWGIVVYSTPLERAEGDPSLPDDIAYLQANQYLIDYDTGLIAFAPQPFDRWFKVDYTYRDAQGKAHDVVDEILYVPANSPYATDHPQGCLLGHPVDWFSETVAITLLNIGANNFSDNPYEFKILDFYRGLVALNPLSRRFIRSARVDYQVMDWRILRETRQLPFTLPADTRLTFANLHELDPTYPGILILDATTGEVIFDERANPPCNPPDRVVVGKDGVLTFNYPNDAGKRVKIFYRPSKDFPLSIQKAATNYRLAPNLSISWREYQLTLNPQTGRWCLYFTPCEKGKTVLVDYWFGDPNNPQKVVGEWGTITRVPETGAGIDDQDPAYDYIVELKGQPVLSVIKVVGASLKVRVAWKTPAERWRKLDLDTVLTSGR
ncbi:type II secretion system protein [bacterium]|nr:type II secretion system protein [bacterium]